MNRKRGTESSDGLAPSKIVKRSRPKPALSSGEKNGHARRASKGDITRGARVVALEKPTDAEKGQWYFQRYVEHLPTRGEIVMLDRSWSSERHALCAARTQL